MTEHSTDGVVDLSTQRSGSASSPPTFAEVTALKAVAIHVEWSATSSWEWNDKGQLAMARG